jgi:branched-chain amino acid transport system ATP-binding protein
MEPVNPVLETVGLTKFFGMVRAADDLSLRFQEGELVGIVGPNGSGKTTLLNVITGYVKPDRGRIRYHGQDITGLPPRAVADLGIARSFQMPQLYLSLTALENLVLALAIRAGLAREFWAPLARLDRLDEARRILEQFGLEEHAAHDAARLPEGARKLLDVALSFARRPRILLMDEPTSGVSARDKSTVMDTLVPVLKGTGVTTIFVEHDMDVVQRYAERVLAFEEGRVIAAGAPDAVFADPAVRRALLGQP